ncbi:hypothetical protein L5515_015583 [Caenorhabditis briggsae]|uniref:BHLH domain-containing protein n=1 Tax=Caenorhabditis briggsae TaxID=6238 RepID=A0AAE9EFH6_CAEBR|nr:hypothetical protein L5515_015583 [Caenorhabditis briggsae]
MTRGKPVTQLNGKRAKRERERYKVINKKIKNLADRLPIITNSKQELAKIATLQLATEYIKTLRMILNEKEDGQNQLPMFPEQQPKVRLASREQILGLILFKDPSSQAEGSSRQASFDETSDPERYFKELDESLESFSSSASSSEYSTSPVLTKL